MLTTQKEISTRVLSRPVLVHVVDPPAYTPPYDHALCAALARAGGRVELVTSRFGYGPVPGGDGYAVREAFYRFAPGAPGSRVRFAARLAQHVPDMLRYRRAARAADVVHFQWLTVQPLDVRLLPRRPLVITAHDVLPREPRPGPARRAAAAVRARGRGRRPLGARPRAADRRARAGPRARARHRARRVRASDPPAREKPLPADLAAVDKPVVLCFGLMRPYKGIDVLLEAWRDVAADAELWVVGMPKMDTGPLRAAAPGACASSSGSSPTRRSPPTSAARTSSSCPTARSTSPACSSPRWPSAGRCCSPTSAASPRSRPRARPGSCRPPTRPLSHRPSAHLLADPAERDRLAAAARAAAAGPYSWDAIARRHLDLYATLA